MNPVSSPLPSTFSYILQPDIVLDFSNQLCFARVVNVSFFHSSFLFYSFLFYPTITIRETYVTTFSSSLIRNRRNKLSYRVISDQREAIFLPLRSPCGKHRDFGLFAFLSGFVRFKSHRSEQGRKPRCQALCGSFYESFPEKLQPSTPLESRWMTGRERVYKRDNIVSSGICRRGGKQSARYERITAECTHCTHIHHPLLQFSFVPAMPYPRYIAHPVPFSLSSRICSFANILSFAHPPLRLYLGARSSLTFPPPFRSLPSGAGIAKRNENLTRKRWQGVGRDTRPI